MTDASEAAALRFCRFIQAAEGKAGSYTPPMVRPAPLTGASKPRLLEIYEACLSELSPEELGEFDRLVEKMSGGFKSPPGALIPQ